MVRVVGGRRKDGDSIPLALMFYDSSLSLLVSLHVRVVSFRFETGMTGQIWIAVLCYVGPHYSGFGVRKATEWTRGGFSL